MTGHPDPLEPVERLVDLSLLTVRTGRDGEPRVDLLQTIRDFAVERLAEANELDQARERHAGHYADLAVTLGPCLHTADQLAAGDHLAIEQDNIQSALDWSLRTTSTSEGVSLTDNGHGLRTAAAMWWFWFVRGLGADARRWLERATMLAAADDDPALASALHGLGEIAFRAGDLSAARTATDRALVVARASGDVKVIAQATGLHGALLVDDDQIGEGRAALEESAALARSVNDQLTRSRSLFWLAHLADDEGDHDRGIALWRESAAITRDLGDERAAVLYGNNLACSLLEAGRPSEAYAELRSLAGVLPRLRDPAVYDHILDTFVDVVAELGDGERTARLLGALNTLGGSVAETSALSPDEQAQRDQRITRLSAAVRSDRWEAAYRVGSTYGWQDAIADALQSGSAAGT